MNIKVGQMVMQNVSQFNILQRQLDRVLTYFYEGLQALCIKNQIVLSEGNSLHFDHFKLLLLCAEGTVVRKEFVTVSISL